MREVPASAVAVQPTGGGGRRRRSSLAPPPTVLRTSSRLAEKRARMAEAEAKAVASATALQESLISPPLQPPSSLLRRAVAAATAVVERAVALLSPLQKPSGGEGASPALEAVTVVPPPSLQVAATPEVAPAVAVPQALEVSAGLQTVPLTVLVTAAPAARTGNAGVPSSVPASSTGGSGENDGWNEGSAPLNPLDVAATKRNLSDLFTAVAVTVPLLPVPRVAAAPPAATTRPFQRRRSSMGVSPGAQALKMRRTSTDGINKGR